ncbi:uncharacterized protein LOC123548698 [Mercenaria mercenaria]|uniref:uncharacterized protein LOC123548698 n=1 Tax=Mercenaria mercenaria TaxID=6596 RepID=UPI001E1D449F|nr:uncharacterized protein LOC123548698 [Mercenaria mercenaria]XP_045192118.1 uncharacterized protein LOC123548698 [Mercenaria mercenaria]XP_045192119.1 uncharacterized protein LOC123548698 [Mercenaria mercenaria]XP_045192120.1 uncharacterized protein LOC123548698 [Mercenaria mercenaria]XP_045192121.1 uncharacterized protein LOC123548698 [Mercenaria mercenaria]XP_045192122.1 uncharacterized protein LOC123548698 [Mercenaria mercenaria]XP_045192123.1 uncharacterized protein LOC123548698 [Mercen
MESHVMMEAQFTDPFRRDEWEQLIIWLRDNFEQDELEKVMYFYQDEGKMETDEENNKENLRQKFYNTIDGDEDKLQAALKLQNVMKARQLHSDLGENLADKIQVFIDRLKTYRAKFEVETKQVFIGRDEVVELVMNLINNDGDISAVGLCGIGGQGKSLLAKQVCMRLAASSPPWIIIKADLRNKLATVDVIKSLLAADGGNFPMYGEQKQLQNVLKQRISQTETDVLFCLDDCDHVLKKERYQFMDFLNNVIMTASESKQKVRLLLTMREKLQERGEKEHKYTLKMSRRFAEVELHELEQADAEDLLRTCANTDIDAHVASAIVKECACSPLAVTVVAELIKNGKFTPERLMFNLQMDKKNVTKALKVDSCIKEAIDNLDTNPKKALVYLSVFQSSPFDLESASRVIGRLGSELQDLYNCHLIEAEELGSLKDKKQKMLYSLHPLVFRYISEWKKPNELKSAYQNFVSHYEKIVSSVVKLLESKYWKGQKKLESHKVHILKFYEIMSEHPELLKSHSKKTDDKGLLVKKRMSDLADILLSLVQNRRMFQSEADRALKARNVSVYIFWMVEKADVFLMLHDKVDIALEILDELSDKYPALRGLHDEPFYPGFVHGLFHKVKGLCRWKQHQHQDALAHLQLSIRFYNQVQLQCRRLPDDKTPYDIFVARIKCYMGQVYLDSGDFGRADQFLTEAHSLVKSMVEARTREEDELAKELHWDIPRYYYHFARIKLMKAKSDEEKHVREELLDKALEDLEKGIKLDEHLKLDYLDGYYSKYKLRADVNVEKGLLMEALDDANYVLDKRREILQPPHTHYTESVYQVGRIYMLIGNDLHQKGETEKARRYWICSSDYFKELKKCHLKDGGISVDNPVFKEIRRDHLKVTALTGNRPDVNQIEHFYRDVETGAYAPEKASSIKSMKQMMWTPVEMMKKYFGGGGKEFGDKDQEITKMENLAREQHERMIRGEPSGGARRDSGMGHSSSDYGELGDSMSSGSGSMSARMDRLRLEKSISLEDDVFQVPDETAPGTSKKSSKKRQKTIDENQES